jgi:hypothetical protein
VLVLNLALISSTKGGLHGKNVRDLEFFVHGDSSSSVFHFVHGESTLLEGEVVQQLGHDVGEHSGGMGLVLQIVAVHEDVLLARVAMQVAVQHKFSFLHELSYQSLHSEDLGVDHLARSLPPPIQVLATQSASVVAIDDSIGVKHRDYLEDEMFPQSSGLKSIAGEEVNDSLHHPRGIGLSRVDSRTQENSFFGLSFGTLRVLILTGNGEVFTFVTCESPSESSSVEEVLAIGVFLNPKKIFLEIGVGVGVAVCEVDLVVIVLESVGEAEGKVVLVVPVALSFVLIGVVVNILANPVPPHSLVLFVFIAETQNAHAVVVQRIRLIQVQNIESHLTVLSGIAYSKEVPLGVSIGIYVILKY